MAVLDLKQPGLFWARAENEDTSTFHLVMPEAKYTKDKLSKNPHIHPGDQLMSPWRVSYKQLDKQGRAVLNLAASGRVNEIMRKLDERFRKGKPPPKKVRGVVVVTQRAGNKAPPKFLVDVQDLDLKFTALLNLVGVRAFVTVQNFKHGWKEFFCDLSVAGAINSVEVSTTPACSMRVDGGPAGKGKIQVPVKEGPKYRIRIAVPFNVRKDTRKIKVPPPYKTWIQGGWRTQGAHANWDPKIGAWVVPDSELHKVPAHMRTHTRTDSREIWTGGDVTIRASGMGQTKTVKLRAESWSSAWLTGPPPKPFYHNVC